MVLWRECGWATAHLRGSWTSRSTQNHPVGVFQLLFAWIGANLLGKGKEMEKATREVSAHTYPDPPPIPPSRVLSSVPSTAALWFLCRPKSHVLDIAGQPADRLRAHNFCCLMMLHADCCWQDHKRLWSVMCGGAQTSSANMAQTNDTLMILRFFVWVFF